MEQSIISKPPFKLEDNFLDDLIDGINWMYDEDRQVILDDFADILEVQSNYIAGAESLIDAKNEILLLRNMIIRFHDENKTWYDANDMLLEVLYGISDIFKEYDTFMDCELDDFMKEHVWNKLVQLIALHLQDDIQYQEYLIKIKSIRGNSITKLYQLRDIIKGIKVTDTVIVDGKKVSYLMEVVWRYGVQLMCNWKEIYDFLE